MTTTIVGCKLLGANGSSLRERERVWYTTEWQTIPGNGAYVAVTSGLTEGGYGPMLVYLECEEPTGAVAPEGVVCFRRVRIIPDAPERITPELRGEIAYYAPGLSSEQRMELARESTPDWFADIAYEVNYLTHEQLVEAVAARERRGSRRINDLTPHQCV